MKPKFIINLSLVTLLIGLTIFSCRKHEDSNDRQENYLKQQFFTLPASASAELQKIAAVIKSQDVQHDFLLTLIKKNGLPVWKSVITNLSNNQSTQNQRGSSINDSLIFFIPFQSLSSSEITSYLVCLKLDTSYNFRFYRKNVLDTINTSNENRQKFLKTALSVFTLFEKQINQKDSLLINGIYNKYFSQASISFGDTIFNGRASRTDFSAYGVETCYRVQCDVQNSARTSVLFECYDCYTNWYIDWGGGGGTSVSWWFDDGGGTYGTGENSNYPPVVVSLINLLNLNFSEADFLANQIDRANEILFYLQTTSESNPNQIAIGHIDRMMNDMQYLSFVQIHAQSNPGGVMWWEDNSFLSSYGSMGYGDWAINYLIANPQVPFATFQNQFMTAPEGSDGNSDATFWDDPNNTYQHQNLPSWSDFETAFPKRSDPNYDTPAKLYASIGGAVLSTVGPNSTTNTCAARVSKALNYSGVTIPNIPGKTYQGSDGKYYFLGAENLNRWMRKTFGCANPNTAIGEYLNTNSVHYNANQIGTNGENG